MELTAAIEGLLGATKILLMDDKVELVSDSTYVLGIARGIYVPKANLDLCRRLREIVCASRHEVSFRWVKGHSGDPWNERVDRLANIGRRMVSRERSGAV